LDQFRKALKNKVYTVELLAAGYTARKSVHVRRPVTK